MPETITSSSNPVVKRVRKLRLRKHREREGAFLVEGITQVLRASEHGAPLETILVAPELLTSERALEWLAGERGGAHVAHLSRELFESLTEREHPSGLAAIVTTFESSLSSLRVDPDSLYVVLGDVGNPGNLGSIVRSMDAVGGSGVILAGSTTDQFHPVAVKASMGALFTIPIARAASLDAFFDWAREAGVTAITTSAHARLEHWDARYEYPCAFVLGSEATGLTRAELEQGDIAVRIPMQGSVTSLNLAVAAGILLYEAARPRRD